MTRNGSPSAARLEKDFQILVAAAIAGERCPQSHPNGPLHSGSVTLLFDAERIRSEVYAHNYRVVTILTGEHAGKSTAPHPKGLTPYLINGRHVDLTRVYNFRAPGASRKVMA